MRDRRAGGERCGGVRDAEAEILVAVDLHRLLQAIDDLLHRVRYGIRRAHADGIGHRQRVHVPFGRHALDDVEEAIELGARGVDGEEDRVESRLFRRDRRFDRRLHGAVHRPAVRVLDHVVADRDLDDHAVHAARLDDFDLLRNTAREREDLRLQSKRGDVLGTFAIYYPEPRSPTPQDYELIDQITHLASIAVERDR